MSPQKGGFLAITDVRILIGSEGLGEVAGPHSAGAVTCCDWEGAKFAAVRVSSDGGSSKRGVWPCMRKLHCPRCAINKGDYWSQLGKLPMLA